MNIWIVTIGSSDVQLDSDNKSRQKGRSESQGCVQSWRDWYDKTIEENQCYDLVKAKFEPKALYKDKDELYRVAPRLLGTVYEMSSPDKQEKIWKYLNFPLLDNFVGKLKESSSDTSAFGGTQSVIAVLLTDQSEFFKSDQERRKPKSPYWQDTCTLKPILNQYFKEKFPDTKCLWIPLFPASSDKGLDDWNYVLDLVRNQLRENLDSEEIQVEPNETVYVSHQAGTPAISSAVQFVSLARFRTSVEFLVSNEYNQQADTIPRSTYLGAIQLQEAKALLKRHNYIGVQDIFGLKRTAPSNPKEKHLKSLLDAGEQWNFAEFQKFKKILVTRNLISVSSFPWYQSGYESIYLAWVRLIKQGNTVDALFHSFRAVEGSISKWVEKRYGSHIIKKGDPSYDSKSGPQLKFSICQELPDYLYELSPTWQKSFQDKRKIGLYGEQLYKLLKEARPEWEHHPDIKIVWEVAKDQRNNLFHRLEGLQESDVFEAWDTNNLEDWKKRILGCLNFIAKEDLSKDFISLEEASLMAKVHEQLEKAIANYEDTP